MNISYEGIGALVVTLPIGTGLEGQLCKIGQSGRVDKCSANEDFCGLVLAVDRNLATVQLEGFVKVGYSGTDLAAGFANLVADGSGKLLSNSAGRQYLVASVNKTDKEAIIKL